MYAAVFAGVMSLGSAALLAQQNRPETMLRAAMETETVKGDLKAAIEQYKAVVQTGSRAQAAQALMRMAECYQKLGDSEARRIYEQLVRDYADQKDLAAAAQARLGATRALSIKGDRAVWTGKDVDLFGTVSPDGRLVTFVDWAGMQNVVVHDLTTGENRPLTPNTRPSEFGWGGFSTISRQGDRVAYQWETADRRWDLRISPLGGSGLPPFRVIYSTAPNTSTVTPWDWSPDAKLLAVTIERADGSTQVGVLSTADGNLRALKTVGWRGVNKVMFSPDGRFVAYDLADEVHRTQSRIFVMAVDASREIAVVDDGSSNVVMGWAEGGLLVYSSDRSGQQGLWTLPVTNGQAQGPARLTKANIGATFPLGLTPSGSLYVWRHASPQFVKVAPFDLATGTVGETAGVFQKFIDSRGRPRWSADGHHVVFVSCGTGGGGPCRLFIRSGDAAVAREVPHSLNYLGFPDVSPDGRSVIAFGTDLKGRRGMFVIDTATGLTTSVPVPGLTAETINPRWSGNRTIQYSDVREQGRINVLIELDLDTNQKTEVFKGSVNMLGIKMSPDRRFIAFVREQQDAKRSEVVVVPAEDGQERVVFSSPMAAQINPASLQWHWDSSALIGLGSINPGRKAWFIPLEGKARPLLSDGRVVGEGVQLSPDGQSIAFAASAGDPGDAVWALENFLSR